MGTAIFNAIFANVLGEVLYYSKYLSVCIIFLFRSLPLSLSFLFLFQMISSLLSLPFSSHCFSSPPSHQGVFLTPLLAVWVMGAGKGISLVSTLSKLGE